MGKEMLEALNWGTAASASDFFDLKIVRANHNLNRLTIDGGRAIGASGSGSANATDLAIAELGEAI